MFLIGQSKYYSMKGKVKYMIIKTLVENTSISEEFNNEHGLSLYIETKQHKLLFDLGASALFVENAKKLNIDLSEIDMVVISHGHFDHGGGLNAFLNVNSKAKVYLNQKAFDKHYSNRLGGEKAYIGLDQGLIPNDRFVCVGDHLIIDSELELFSNIKGTTFNASGNKNLLMEFGDSMMQDDFSHEQNLIIKENGKTLLVAGCAHSGIVNIIEHLRRAKHDALSHVIGGFHLYNRVSKSHEDPALIRQIAEYLKSTASQYYTCHCTGIEPYGILKGIMGEKIKYLTTGSTLTI